jgi:hypothetical protein
MAKVKSEPKKGGAAKKLKVAKAKAPAKRAKKAGGGCKSLGKQGILNALVQLKGIGMAEPERKLVATLALYKAKSSGFKKALTELVANNSVEYKPSNTLKITALGESQASAGVDSVLSNATLHDQIKKMLPPKAKTIFDVLADGKVHTRLELAHAAKYSDDLVSAA